MITVNSLDGRSRKKQVKVTVLTMLLWIIRFLRATSPFRWSMYMDMVVLASVGK